MNKKIVLLVVMLCASLLGNAQVVLSEHKHDFGVIEEGSTLWFEVTVENKSDKDALLLRIANPDNEFEFKFSNMKTPAKGQTSIRIQFNPKEKGKRKITLPLYFDHSTEEIVIMANVKHLNLDYTPCPDFDRVSSVRAFDTEFTIYNAITLKPIDKAKISINNGQQYGFDLVSSKKGWVKESIPLSYYYMRIQAVGYEIKDTASYINSKNHRFAFYLTPIVSEEVVQEEEVEESLEERIDEVLVVDNEEQEVVEEVLVENEEVEGNKEFSSREYVSNNIVFLMDVSTSMKKENRLEMLKTALLSLSDMMRDDDVITLITYASTTEILIEGHAMGDKETIKTIIANIDGKGTTAGGKGIKKAYAIAKQYEIEGGNNHIYIATDGAFNKTDGKLVKLIAKQAKKGYHLSVISLNSSEFAIKKMTELVEAGQGEMVDIKEMENVTPALKSLIKKQSRIHK